MIPTITNNFNAPIGQYIAHVDKIEAHFDKDMTMHVNNDNPPPDTPETPDTITTNIAEYFKGPFRGFGGGTDYFSMLKKELENDYSDTDICRIAVLIYKSHVLNNRRPHTFKEWYKIFTQAFQLAYFPKRQPRHFLPSAEIKAKFPYIT